MGSLDRSATTDGPSGGPRRPASGGWTGRFATLLVVATIAVLGWALVAARDSWAPGWDLLPFIGAVALTARTVGARRRSSEADWVWTAGLAFGLTAFLAFGAIEAALVMLAGSVAAAVVDRYAGTTNWSALGSRTARTILGLLAGGAAVGTSATDPLTLPGDEDLARFVPFLVVYLLVQFLVIGIAWRVRQPLMASHPPAWLAQRGWPPVVRALAWELVSVLAAAALGVVIDTVGLRLDYWVACLIALVLLFGINRLLDLNAELRDRNADLRRAMTELRTLSAVGHVLSATIDVDRLCVELAAQLGRWSRADAITIALIDPARTRVRIAYHAYSGVRQPERFEEMPELTVGPPAGISRDAPRRDRERIPGDGIISQVIATQRSVVGADTERFPLVRPDGTALPAGRSGVRHFHSAAGVPLLVAGELIGAIALKSHQPGRFNDEQVTLLGRIGAQAAMAIRNAEIVASERTSNRARQDFLTVVSHELRTPITSISGYAQLLARRLSREARQPAEGKVASRSGQGGRPEQSTRRVSSHLELVDVISAQSRHLGRLVDDLVTLSGLGQGTMRFDMDRIDLTHVVSEAVERTRETMGQPDLLRFEAPGELVVTGDPRRLREVFDNLIGNAIIYGPPGAPIDVWLGEVGLVAEVRVTDRGKGIPMDAQARIFEPFFRGIEEEGEIRHGLGLGLSISREIVVAHGGTISVLSDVDAGATFIVRLQLAGAGPGTPSTTA